MSPRFFPAFAFAGVMLAIAVGFYGPSHVLAANTPAKDRKPAPELVLKDASGASVKLSAYKGKVVLLNFWATWCGPCRAEIPWFVEFENKYKAQGFAVLGVSTDDDGWDSVRPYMQRMKMNYAVMVADPVVTKDYGGLESLPETILIDREGRTAARHVGITEKGNYEAEVVELLRR